MTNDAFTARPTPDQPLATGSEERFVHSDVPFVGQWETRTLIGKIISSELDSRLDPGWKASGAASRDEYHLWSKNVCGMACLSMILSHNAVDHAPLVVLGKRCARYGGYIVKGDEIDGLFYAPFIDFVADEFRLDAAVAAPMTTEAMIGYALRGDYVIVSVHHAIRHPSSHYCGPVGGHLVLVVGVDVNQRSIWINNPSGDTAASQEYAELSLEDFGRYYAGRGIVVSSSSFLPKR